MTIHMRDIGSVRAGGVVFCFVFPLLEREAGTRPADRCPLCSHRPKIKDPYPLAARKPVSGLFASFLTDSLPSPPNVQKKAPSRAPAPILA